MSSYDRIPDTKRTNVLSVHSVGIPAPLAHFSERDYDKVIQTHVKDMVAHDT
ncbi:MAG: hypothetical protein ACOC9B_02805 [Chloroflexota bacterium]